MLMDICAPKFDNYQSTVSPNFFKRRTLLMSLFFSKKTLSDVRSEIHLVRRNNISIGQSVRALKILYSGLKVGVASQVTFWISKNGIN